MKSFLYIHIKAASFFYHKKENMKKENMPKVMLLSPLFYERYADNTEILVKKNRPYLVLLVEYRSFRFAIPFRSNIQHTHAYKFESENSKRTSSGLDFSKSVIIFNDDEIGMPAHIDSREHTEVMKRYMFIVEKFQKYIDDFVEGLKKDPLQPKYKFSSLTYYRSWLLNGV